MDLARMSWLTIVLACLLAALVLFLRGEYGYAGVSVAVSLSALINLF